MKQIVFNAINRAIGHLVSGGEVEAQHYDLKTEEGKLVKDLPQKRIYAG